MDLGLKNFSGREDHFDLEGDIIVVRFGTRVVGGCRINYSLPQKREFLPLEQEGFYMVDMFPELKLEDKNESSTH